MIDLAAVFRDAPSDAAKYGVIGWPLFHTLSPAMHEAAIRALGLKAAYRAIPLEPGLWMEFIAQAAALPLDGFNVTVPYKERILAEPPPSWKGADSPVGAVNTVRREGSAWRGHNTDAGGFADDLAALGWSVKGKSVVLAGAGGAARAALAAFGSGGAARVVLLNRTPGKAAALKEAFQGVPIEIPSGPEAARGALRESSLLVNATSVGLAEADPSPVDPAWLTKGLAVYDMVYHRETALLKAARGLGARASGGLGMLVHQGARAFKIWFNVNPPIEIMRKAAEDELKRRPST